MEYNVDTPHEIIWKIQKLLKNNNTRWLVYIIVYNFLICWNKVLLGILENVNERETASSSSMNFQQILICCDVLCKLCIYEINVGLLANYLKLTSSIENLQKVDRKPFSSDTILRDKLFEMMLEFVIW